MGQQTTKELALKDLYFGRQVTSISHARSQFFSAGLLKILLGPTQLVFSSYGAAKSRWSRKFLSMNKEDIKPQIAKLVLVDSLRLAITIQFACPLGYRKGSHSWIFWLSKIPCQFIGLIFHIDYHPMQPTKTERFVSFNNLAVWTILVQYTSSVY